MQDIKKIIENKEKYAELIKNKNLKIDLDSLLFLYERRTELNNQIEALRAKRNSYTEEMKMLGGKPSEDLIKKGKDIKEKLSGLESEYNDVDIQYNRILMFTPQFVSDDTPIGKDESENVEVKRWSPEKGVGGDPKDLGFKFKDHIELGNSLNLLDLDRGVKTSGFRGYYLKNEGAMMHMALMMYGLKLMQQKGFEVIVPPTLVKEQALFGSGHFPFDEENVYVADSLKNTKENAEIEGKDKKFLVGTAEPSLLNYYRDEIIDEAKLPIRMAGFSQCYRSEIGSYGRDTKGLYRIHEFMKIEQVVICKDDYEESEKLHQQMLGFAEELLQSLQLPYRVIQLCTGDMGAGKYKMFDIETWMPSRNAYGETHSASNLGDWQTRRLNLKVKTKDGEKYFPHALNNTVVASPRILIALWENYQNEDGTITVPEVLREYIGKDVIGR